jgi:hypothetical protein
VDRTFQVTLEGAETTRTRAQDAVDELVKGAEAGAEAVRDRVRRGIEERRPATSDDIREVRADLRAIVRRLESIEERLPKPPAASRKPAAKRSSAAKRYSGARASSAAKRSSGAKRAGASSRGTGSARARAKRSG